MNRTERILIKVGVLVGIPVLAFAGLFLGNPHPASTQAVDTPTPTANASMTPPTSNSNIQSYEDLLARQLNVSVDQLRNAEAQARGQYFDQLVNAGVLNQSQGAALKDVTAQ
ncbi:MAG TPA: hypothetical protein VFY10_10455 [Dehalococcoidia bacterium]|nr:hypothetical protein [Dehalococcoidia bacterium]